MLGRRRNVTQTRKAGANSVARYVLQVHDNRLYMNYILPFSYLGGRQCECNDIWHYT